MTLFDTLGQLETYVPAFPALARIISVMDRSLPYDQEDGTYSCPEDDSVTYLVTSATSSPHGHPFSVKEGTLSMIVALDGEEIVSNLDSSSVFTMIEGRFLILGPGDYKRGVMTNLPAPFRDVRFTFPDKT